MDNQDKARAANENNSAAAAVSVNPHKMERYLQDVRDNQNLTFALLGGLGAASVGAAIWALITVVTEYQIGWMAIGIGFLVGYAVRIFGKGVDTLFGVTGAFMALLGCLAGNLLTVVIVVSRQDNIGVLTLLSRLTPGITVDILKETFKPMDALFYGLAVYEGYKLSFKTPTKEELAALTK
jgi:hypothetical protein